MSDYIYVALPKNSMYTDSFNRISSWLLDSGLNSKWMRDVIEHLQNDGIKWAKSKENVRMALENTLRIFMESTVQAFELKHFAVAFGILIVGLSLAGIGFCLEKLSNAGFNTVMFNVQKYFLHPQIVSPKPKHNEEVRS
ncbi:unnamed protein product [Allacma fusca]|uniref:Uncharacterized protein n=1 Tax=Allacma fusca TaxID=39272 RepID=A0A8J2PDH2_9HEXA|nr:unnamed protein product [Allacma fusca]